jgi:hypothetical protein
MNLEQLNFILDMGALTLRILVGAYCIQDGVSTISGKVSIPVVLRVQLWVVGIVMGSQKKVEKRIEIATPKNIRRHGYGLILAGAFILITVMVELV